MITSLKSNFKKILSRVGYYFTLDSIELNNPIRLYKNDEILKSYNFFKEYFPKTVLFSEVEGIRKYSLEKSLENIEEEDLILEFGVYKAESTKFFSDIIYQKNKKNIIYGFDSFEGLSHDWIGNIDHPKDKFLLNSKLSKLDKNIKIIKGRVEKTIDEFINKNSNKISFVHFDLDLYEPTKYILERIKKRIKSKGVLLFDQMYGVPGWQKHEFRAFTETFTEDEFEYLSFGPRQIAIILK